MLQALSSHTLIADAPVIQSLQDPLARSSSSSSPPSVRALPLLGRVSSITATENCHSGAMSNANSKPKKPCHNCRRQRLRCDRSTPHCNKCTLAGKECLGYGQLFRWTDSVASRGHLAGQTSSHVVCSASGTEMPQRREKPKYVLMGQNQFKQDGLAALNYEDEAQGRTSPDPQLVIQKQDPHRCQGDMVSPSWPYVVSQRVDYSPSAPWVLADPLYQDMDYSHRFYLSYFATRLCLDLVSYDLPNRNPFRGLLPLTHCSPLLQHVIVANAASHMSNITSLPCFNLVWDDPLSPGEICPERNEASRRMVTDSLVAKHKALQLMNVALQDIDAWGRDVVFAAALFFVNVELIESGRDGWRAHLDGACNIMTLLHHTETSDPVLRDYLLSDCSVYLIFASAFLPITTPRRASSFQPHEIRDMLDRAAANSYICCPPEVLEILHIAAQLPSASDSTSEEATFGCTRTAADLIKKAEAFDFHEWAVRIHSSPSYSSLPMESRMHVGAAHGVATCLYILQAAPQCIEHLDDGEHLEDRFTEELVQHLSVIPDQDPNFKATSWPTFVLGAGARGYERRKWVMHRMRRLVLQVPWGFLYTAMDTLQAIWGLDPGPRVRDLQEEDQGPQAVGKRQSWLQTLKENDDLNFLIV